MASEENPDEQEEENPTMGVEKEKKKTQLKEKYGVTEEIPERASEKETETRVSREREVRDTELSEILLKVEKLDGKLEVLKDFKENVDERINMMSESIGELRSVLLEKEKFLSKVEKDMEIVTDSVSGLETEKIKKQFLKRDTDMEEVRANIEKLENMILTVQQENRKFLEVMEKVKNVENLIAASERIEGKLAKIEETKAYSERVSSKIEAIFSELNEKLREFERRKEQIDKVDELTVDIVKMLDSMSVKFTDFVSKEEFESFKNDISKKVGKTGHEKVETTIEAMKPEDDETWMSLKEKWKDKFVKSQAPL